MALSADYGSRFTSKSMQSAVMSTTKDDTDPGKQPMCRECDRTVQSRIKNVAQCSIRWLVVGTNQVTHCYVLAAGQNARLASEPSY